MNALTGIHAVRNVGPMNDDAIRRIESMVRVWIDNHLERFATRSHRLAELDARLRRRPIVAVTDVNTRRYCWLPSIACAQRGGATGIERDRGAEERRRACFVAECSDIAVAKIDCGKRRATAVRPADQCDAITCDVGTIR